MEDRRDYRVPPHNFEAEMALLGAILTNNNAYDKVADFLRAEHFADPRHAKIFEACAALIDEGKAADPITLKGYFEHDGELEKIGGPAYLARLSASVISVVNAEDYGRTVHDRWMRRDILFVAEDLTHRAYNLELDATAEQVIDHAMTTLGNLIERNEGGRGPMTAIEAAERAYENAKAARERGGVSGITTDLIDLDAMLGGLTPTDLIIIAGRPGMGKSGLATTIAVNVAKRKQRDTKQEIPGERVGFFSLEMSSEQLGNRIVSGESGVDSQALRQGQFSDVELYDVNDALTRIEHLPLDIDDRGGLSIHQLARRARRKHARKKFICIIVDYLQLLDANTERGFRMENRTQEVTFITNALKALAKELNVPVIAVSQLSRQVEQRENKRPMLADLRESGSIEQDADVVIFVYREVYYVESNRPVKKANDTDMQFQAKCIEHESYVESIRHIAEAIVAKQRNGKVGVVKLHFNAKTTMFGNLARGDGR